MLGAAGQQRLRAQPVGRSMLGAIDELVAEEREVFGRVRIQGMTQAEAARVLGVSPKTVKRAAAAGGPSPLAADVRAQGGPPCAVFPPAPEG